MIRSATTCPHALRVCTLALILLTQRSRAAHNATYDLSKAPGSAMDAVNVLAYGAAASDNAGDVVLSGDLNGDGIDDLIVGASNADVGVPTRANAGAVYVWFGQGTLAGTKDAAASAGTAPNVTILGATAGDTLTNDGAMALGDVNGDGTPDLLLGARFADGPADGRTSAGEAYIIYGRKSPVIFPSTLDLAVQGGGGADVTIFGATASDGLTLDGSLVLGDVNGDGTVDLLLGASSADGPSDGRNGAGEAYIVFGRASPASFPATLDLAVQGSSGANVTLYGATTSDQLTSGGALEVGDVNGDGTDDILLGARMADGPGDARSGAGEGYIIFGRASPASFPVTLDLGVQGSSGTDVTLYGATANDFLTNGGTLAVGDVNGDGTDDLLLGANGADGPVGGRDGAGEAYIIFGRASPATFPATLDLGVQGSSGANVTLYGASVSDQLTFSGALTVGDVNGDGVDDVLVSSSGADGPVEGRTGAGDAYIVFGRASPANFPSTLDMAVQGNTGANVTIYGATSGDNLTFNAAFIAGDVNGDGTADLILGAPQGDGAANGRSNSGEVYVIYGRKSPSVFPSTLDLSIQGSSGADVTVYGGSASDFLTNGGALAVGDVNGDGVPDLLMGASPASGPAEARAGAGEAYVLYGVAPPNPDADNDGLLDSWELTHWPSTTGHSALDDSDHDGYCELLELALGLNPTLPSASGLPPAINEGGYLTMTITKQAGVSYEVQSAGSLLPAQPDSFSAASTTVLTNNATTLKVRDNFLISTSPPRFMRVKVTASP